MITVGQWNQFLCNVRVYFAIFQSFIEPDQIGKYFGNLDFLNRDLLNILTGIPLIIAGLMCAAFGEIIGVLFAIEKNTR